MLCSLQQLISRPSSASARVPSLPSAPAPSTSLASPAQHSFRQGPALPNSTVLVIASKGTADIVKDAAHSQGLTCHTLHSMQDALTAVMLDEQMNIRLIVTALGRSPAQLLFSRTGTELIAAATAKHIPVCVFSHHASKHVSLLRECLDAGAIAVIDKTHHMNNVLTQLLAQPPPNHLGMPALPASEYPTLQHRMQWLTHLRHRYGDSHKSTQRFLSTTRALQDMIQRTPPLAALRTSPADDAVRFVVISDTHNQHRSLSLPAGEVLLHCGDITANYNTAAAEMMEQLLDVAQWMHSLTQYNRIFITAGNHDTLLDAHTFPAYAAAYRAFVAALPPHASLLIDGGAVYRGLRLWASPTVVDRVETDGKRYCSSGFERPEARRAALWSQLPDGLDVLMTHTPPDGSHGDHLLAAALSRLQAPPLVHVFGHSHGEAGCGMAALPAAGAGSVGATLRINAAQDLFLHKEPGAGGVAWVFDLPSRG